MQYRYKKNSKMRNRERTSPEVPRLMRCLFPDLYPVRKLLVDHHELLKPNGFSEMVSSPICGTMLCDGGQPTPRPLVCARCAWTSPSLSTSTPSAPRCTCGAG